MRAYYVNAAFQPQFELDDAMRLAKQLNADMKVLTADVLSNETVVKNPSDRCYHCKKALFTGMAALAEAEGFPTLAEGSNADDTGDYRPGMAAVRELGAVSPLLEARLTKADIRTLSRRLGLSTWNRPSAACLASRICYGEPITREKLSLVEQAEAFLTGLGLGQLRVRLHGALARIEVLPDQFSTVLAHRDAIVQTFLALGCSYVTLDLTGYQTGSLNRLLPK